MAKRTICALGALYHTAPADDVEHRDEWENAKQGQEVELRPDEEARLEAQGALVPVGVTLESHLQAKMDAYRAGRGDGEAAARLADARSGGIVDLSKATVEGDAARLATHISATSPTVDETVALAEDDPAKAAVVLEAENLVTHAVPRKGVVQGLKAIIDGG